MHFLLLGASGRTGQKVVAELLSHGHTAVALVRKPESLTKQAGLTIAVGSPLSKPDIRNALTAAPGLVPAATIFTLNTVRRSDSPFAAQVSPPRFLADSCANACEVLEEAGISRLIVMSTAGAGDSWSNLPLLSKAFLGWTNVRFALKDHNILDKEIRETNLDFTLVRAVRLEFEEGKESMVKNVRTLGTNGEGMGMADSINVPSVAKFLVRVATSGLYSRSAVVVTN